MKRAIVFGGSGFLGSYVCDELLGRKYEVVIADIIEPTYSINTKYMYCDILDIENIKNVMSEGFDYVYNFAGLADINSAYNRPIETINLNVIGNLNILESCENEKLKRFVYASSAYSVNTKGSFYGISKHTSEKIIEEYHRRFDLPFTVIRYGSLYGERADESNYIYNVLKQAVTEKKLSLKGKGDEEREYIHAFDAARLSVDVIEDDKFINEHIILTGVEKLKRKELLGMISEILNDKIIIEHSEIDYPGHYKITPYEFHPNIAKKLVANPYIDMGQGIVECVKSIYDEIGKKYEDE